ncbi:alpha/beta fold hydrolase [Kitasatospora sp. GP82]|uniref:alpha/beta fold hydrolase n=1 Tax=Kitasatospora sp. GP82 TaxID=3035089 RepID=UPI0024743538|nr:alpha/beta fold hydrolase [Kitasatospora sp. GP82]MDH6123996.1 pimeloyl-ACP methyl ester carboxylesterase [Kitasatospora sp. GP82]
MTDASDTFTFETEDGFLAYRDTGTGRPLVLLHSGFVDHTVWDDQLPALARHYRVIAPDARGHGGSSNATMPFRQADDLAALLRHLDVGPAVLVGLSMGAIIAVDTALEHPDLVHALVVSGGGTPEFEFRDSWAKDVHDAQSRALAAGDIEGWMEAFLLWAAGPQRTLEDVRPDIVQRLRQMAWRTLAKHTAAEPDHRVPVPGTPARVKEIAVPVLALNGAIDAPELAGLAEHVARAVADGRVTTIEGAAHYPNLEQPDAFNQALGDFLHTVYARKG